MFQLKPVCSVVLYALLVWDLPPLIALLAFLVLLSSQITPALVPLLNSFITRPIPALLALRFVSSVQGLP